MVQDSHLMEGSSCSSDALAILLYFVFTSRAIVRSFLEITAEIPDILFYGVDMGNIYFCSDVNISCSRMDIEC